MRQTIVSSQVRNVESPRKPAQLLPGDDEGLLGRVLGVFPGAECRQRGAIHDPLVQADQGAKGVLVPGPRGRDERRDFRGFPAFVHLSLAGGKRHEGGDGNRHWDSRHQGRDGWLGRRGTRVLGRWRAGAERGAVGSTRLRKLANFS